MRKMAVVAELLELAELPQGHRVAEREGSRGGVHAEVDAKGAVLLEEAAEFALHLLLERLVAVVHAAHEDVELVVNRGHGAVVGFGHLSNSRACATSRAI
jgi:hypothetical protein